ncbi:LLM class F420-dependent oxidoreductase [Yimella sp. cx-573]|nr:LLM class F420-dependent oxidoreductase [Yimella sp. cx-573]
MRLGLNLGYWGTTGTDDLEGMLRLSKAADEHRYDVVWLAEVYGSDIPSLTGYLAAHTTNVGYGAAIMQIPARTPAMTAMTAATLDRITGGRFHLGLGVSGPQVSEGWYGVRFADPLGRTREYVEIVRKALGRRNVEFHGQHFELPLPDGPGKALRLLLLPEREDVPIYLASLGPKNLELTGEIADGWIGIFVSPEYLPEQLALIERGRQKSDTSLDGFDVVASVNVSLADDIDVAADRLRGHHALYVGGMGSKNKNFYHALAARMGFQQQADHVQDLFLAKQHRDAAAAMPREFIERTAIVGDTEAARSRLRAYAQAGVTTLAISPWMDSLEERVELVGLIARLMDEEGLRDS